MHCVLLSRTLDLRQYLAEEIARLKGRITFVDHLAGDESAGTGLQHVALVDVGPADTTGRRDCLGNRSRPEHRDPQRLDPAGEAVRIGEIGGGHEFPQESGLGTLQSGGLAQAVGEAGFCALAGQVLRQPVGGPAGR